MLFFIVVFMIIAFQIARRAAVPAGGRHAAPVAAAEFHSGTVAVGLVGWSWLVGVVLAAFGRRIFRRRRLVWRRRRLGKLVTMIFASRRSE